MKNKEYYQKTFSRLTASEDVIQEVMNMEQKKVYRFTKRTVGIAAAAALTLTATGAAYAATDGNFAQLLERITVYINGEEADMGDYEIFEDENGKTNLDLSSVNGELLIISQFTLYADCKRGNRPSFVKAGKPDFANEMYEYILKKCSEIVPHVAHGLFGEEMNVSLINSGPFTILLDSDEIYKR